MTKKKKERPDPEIRIDGSGDIVSLLAKARASVSPDLDATSALQRIHEDRKKWTESNAISPPYDPESLMIISEISDCLGCNIAGYQQNIEGNGHRFDVMDGLRLESDDVVDKIRFMLEYERDLNLGEQADDVDTYEITDDDVTKKIEELKKQAAVERMKARSWFANCGIDQSFTSLRMMKRYDEEAVGHAAWECIRDKAGKLRRLRYIPGHTIYPTVDDGTRVTVEAVEQISPITSSSMKLKTYLPVYVQIEDGKKIYHKTIGDPRVVSQATGKPYDVVVPVDASGNPTRTEEQARQSAVLQMRKEEDDDEAKEATEVLWFVLHSPRTPAGVPRWISALLNVLGNRGAAQINHDYLDNKAVPPVIMFVSGKLHRETRQRLESFMSREVKGRNNFHKMMVIDDYQLATPATATDSTKTTVHFERLNDVQNGDSLFQEYSKTNRDVVGASFRQPPALRGETPSDLNRATYLGSLQYGEQQVYAQPRKQFDDIINRYILPEILGPKHIIRFVSNSPLTSDPAERAKLIDAYNKAGAIVPADLRPLAAADFNTDLEEIEEEWVKQPIALTLSQGSQMSPESPPTIDEMEEHMAAFVHQELRAKLGHDIEEDE